MVDDDNLTNNCGIVLVTVGSESEAQKIANLLVAEKLVACVNFFPVTSVYRWQEEVCCDAEWQLIMKTDLKIFPQLENRIRELHSYEVAEIIALPIVNISPPYLHWMQNNLRSS